jgi:peptidoglycan/xylan/chitin deacetylase (PgdA/CDA1 family)
MRKAILYTATAIFGIALFTSALFIQDQSPTVALSSKSSVVVTNFQQDHGFVKQSGAGSQADDNSTFSLGEQSLRLTTEGDGTSVFTRKTVSPALNFTDRALKVWVKVDSVDNIRELRISATGDDFRTWIDYWISASNADARFLRNDKWNVITLSPGQASVTGRPDTSRIDTIQVRVTDTGSGRPVTVWFNGIALVQKNDRAIVTFAFDDGYETDYTRARPVLDKYHFSATSYVVGSLVGGSGRLSMEQLKSLQELNGWDIASHSYTHANLTARARPEIDENLRLSKEFLERNGFYKGSDHFAYPHGEFDNDELRSLVQEYFATARTTAGPSETLPPSDPHRLRAMLVLNDVSPEEISRQVQAAMAGGDWLILVFHRIVESEADDETEYLQSDFESIVDDVASRGVEVLTVSEVHALGFH